MDLQKIGAYIAGKRKALGLTQRELAEKLGMSDKSVSKWERGVCLPDVSLYQELCGILGITLNEFFAGEDLDVQSLPQRSEENLITVSSDGERRRKRSRRIITALLCAALLLTAVLAWSLTVGARAEKNLILPYSKDSAERKTAELLSGPEGAFLFRYSTDGGFTELNVYHTLYHHGSLVSREALFTAREDDVLLREGILGLVPEFDSQQLKCFITGDGVKISTELPVLENEEEWEYFGRASVERDPVSGIEDGREYVLLALCYGRDTLRTCPLSVLESGGLTPPENAEMHCLSVVFSKGGKER